MLVRVGQEVQALPRRLTETRALTRDAGTLARVAELDGKPLDERLQEIGAQLAWVRDYL